jgi:hypothetical protein
LPLCFRSPGGATSNQAEMSSIVPFEALLTVLFVFPHLTSSPV